MTEQLLRRFVRDYEKVQDAQVRERYGMLSGGVGIFLNLLLSAGKFFAGVLTGSISITADAFNNLSDAGSSVVTLVGFRLAGQKADDDHPFGHGRIEYLAGLLVSMLILLVGVELGKSSIEKILHPEPVVFSAVSAGILLCSIAVKLWMCFFNRNLSRRIGSAAMAATAMDSLSDVVATSAVRQEGTSLHYMPLEFPAVADFDVTDALRQGAASTGASVHTGVVQSKDSFYGQHEPSRMPVAHMLEEKWKAWKQAGVLCSEMESAALFVVSSVLGLRAGALFAVLWNQERKNAGLPDPHCMDTDLAIRAAVEGLRCLIARDAREEGL